MMTTEEQIREVMESDGYGPDDIHFFDKEVLDNPSYNRMAKWNLYSVFQKFGGDSPEFRFASAKDPKTSLSVWADSVTPYLCYYLTMSRVPSDYFSLLLEASSVLSRGLEFSSLVDYLDQEKPSMSQFKSLLSDRIVKKRWCVPPSELTALCIDGGCLYYHSNAAKLIKTATEAGVPKDLITNFFIVKDDNGGFAYNVPNMYAALKSLLAGPQKDEWLTLLNAKKADGSPVFNINYASRLTECFFQRFPLPAVLQLFATDEIGIPQKTPEEIDSAISFMVAERYAKSEPVI